jgi:hypothetical protein
MPKLLRIEVGSQVDALSEAELELKRYQKLYASTTKKLKEYWKMQSYSAIASEKIKKYLGMGFIIHNKTRWNSSYRAVGRIIQLADEKKEGFAELCKDLKIAPFTENELIFMREYKRVSSYAVYNFNNQRDVHLFV